MRGRRDLIESAPRDEMATAVPSLARALPPSSGLTPRDAHGEANSLPVARLARRTSRSLADGALTEADDAPTEADDAPTDYVEHRVAEHSAVLGGMFVDVGYSEAFSLICDVREPHEVAATRGVRAATVLAMEAAVVTTGRAQQAGRALAVEVAFATEPRPGDHRRRSRRRRGTRRSP